MAVMLFRESNEIKWVGVRPGHKGTQVLQMSTANNATVILYTVPPGKTLFLLSGVLRSINNVTGGGVLYIKDDLGVSVFELCATRVQTNFQEVASVFSVAYPLELAEGFTVNIYSSGVGVIIYGSIFGWEE